LVSFGQDAGVFVVPHPGSRRRFLQQLGTGLGVAVAASMAKAEAGGVRGPVDPLKPFSPRLGDIRPRAKSVIFLFMVGGPSQVDTFDHKPVLQKLNGQAVPASFRKAMESTRHANVFHGCKDVLMGSPFGWKQHGSSGMWVSDLFPSIAGHVDDLCFIHSMQAESNNHAPASYQLHTGDIRPGKASLGSWVTYGLGTENQDLPAYVMLFDAGPLGGAANYSNGYLPASFQPTRLRDVGTPVLDLLPPPELADGQRATLDTVRELNLLHRSDRVGRTDLDARIASYELAYRMQSAALDVGGIESEAAWLRKGYGLEHSDRRTVSFGRKCLLARRLVEKGVRFVQLYDMPDKDGWDAHDALSKNHVPRARWTDQPVAALLADLKQRGLLDSTLVIWASEFGRTPMMQGNDGRQHNAAGFTIWMAGGGVRPGVRIGSTDELGLMAVDAPVSFKDLHATILAAVGLEHEGLSYRVDGRDERLTGIAGGARVVPGVLAG
jgi:hypothetical protein